MKLNPLSVDPTRLLKPTSVARQLNVDPSMVTHWMQGNTLDFVEVDSVKFIPIESVAVLEALRKRKADAKAERLAEAERDLVTA